MGAGCTEELVNVKILPDINKYFQVGASMSSEERVQVLLFLVQNIDVFAWNPYEVPGVNPGFIVHKLNVDPSYPPKKQKPRRSTKDHIEAVRQEVEKLKEAEAIKETFFPEWLANTVVVWKKNGKWRLLKKWKRFRWDDEREKAFQNLKEYLVRAPMLSAPEPGEELFMYLSVSEHAVSVVLLKDQGVQQPVYYISKTQVDAETRYLPLEKLVLALVHATRKLPQYFQAHTRTWLGAFDVRYKPRSAVKGQVLADFVAEFSPKGEMVCQLEHRPWKVHVDGASNTKGAGAGIVIITPEGILLEHSFRLGFNAFNNEAEYEALLARLRVVSRLEARDVEVYSDSRLIVNQVQGSFEARDPRMKAYLDLVKQVMDDFCTVKVIQVARAQNRHADSLATLASSIAKDILRLIRVELVPEPSIKVAGNERAAKVEVTAVATLRPSWMDPIIDFLADDQFQTMRRRPTRSAGWLPGIGCPETGNSIVGHLEGHIFHAYT
ncbi:uncharacterized protein LOC115960505 [Quercus lobata]|uniref:uncharacterized protein LOC115960505 n=1 Tax=Quercus lobata TaxID=97700 RepID=UPI00124880CA|nr:uncharacterized protein LOC115960505 [Quercus lobata]